jgi:hypothetical protein
MSKSPNDQYNNNSNSRNSNNMNHNNTNGWVDYNDDYSVQDSMSQGDNENDIIDNENQTNNDDDEDDDDDRTNESTKSEIY